MESNIKRGDLYFADLSPVVGSEQGGMRPVLIVQNNVGNHYSPTVIVAAITSRITKPKMPTHVGMVGGRDGLERDSVILLEQVRTIDKQRLRDRIATLPEEKMREVDNALSVSLALKPLPTRGKR
ncbi:type II toxin-antitoxin system PemK/MazF family toxin [Lacticaseibacillus hulanensis]|jgi:mRNA interferase MazF|uniref:type II toxin-antitoxin system PemK/MazF family toxin n=1 Tax=Lacticaseibacillus hulanensis TaxID=2493111 RepID=UPI000FDCCE9E|nr:type II toxin-antitoxin system PemK/MazF family toxin [Lacticaseibacillus hulanensis]